MLKKLLITILFLSTTCSCLGMEIKNPTIRKIANLNTNGVVTTSGGDGTLGVSPYTGVVGITIDGGGSAITTGVKGYIIAPYACTITGWNIVCDGASPTITIDVWKVASGTTLPVDANSITAAAVPALSSGNAIHSTTLTDWTTAITANDIIGFNVDACATATKATLTLEVTKT